MTRNVPVRYSTTNRVSSFYNYCNAHKTRSPAHVSKVQISKSSNFQNFKWKPARIFFPTQQTNNNKKQQTLLFVIVDRILFTLSNHPPSFISLTIVTPKTGADRQRKCREKKKFKEQNAKRRQRRNDSYHRCKILKKTEEEVEKLVSELQDEVNRFKDLESIASKELEKANAENKRLKKEMNWFQDVERERNEEIKALFEVERLENLASIASYREQEKDKALEEANAEIKRFQDVERERNAEIKRLMERLKKIVQLISAPLT